MTRIPKLAAALDDEPQMRKHGKEGQLFQHQFTNDAIRELNGTLKYPDSAASGTPVHNQHNS